MILLEDQFNLLIETVDGFFGRDSTPSQARRAFCEYRDGTLSAIPEMTAEFLADSPYLAAIGFLGMVQFKDCPEFKAFKAKPSAATLAALTAADGLAMRRSAHAGWEFLKTSHAASSIVILSLCALCIGNKVVDNALK